jgi:hypothetical protein
MKRYVKPVFEVAQVKVSERIAGTSCRGEGSCWNDNWTRWECPDNFPNPIFESPSA